jgi:hypothetical protein
MCIVPYDSLLDHVESDVGALHILILFAVIERRRAVAETTRVNDRGPRTLHQGSSPNTTPYLSPVITEHSFRFLEPPELRRSICGPPAECESTEYIIKSNASSHWLKDHISPAETILRVSCQRQTTTRNHENLQAAQFCFICAVTGTVKRATSLISFAHRLEGRSLSSSPETGALMKFLTF